MRFIIPVFVAYLLVPRLTLGDNWPSWRGPHGTGVSAESNLPTTWSHEDNVHWKVPLPGPGNSTPVVWGDRVFVTCANPAGTTRSLLSFHFADGTKRWQADVHYADEEKSHKTNPQCSPSPVTDGHCVAAWFGSAGLHVYDMDGKKLWEADLGKFEHIWGYAASPVIYQDLVILSAGPGLSAFLVAFDKQTGKEVWRQSPPESISEKVDEFRGSWATPVFYQDGNRTLMLCSLPLQLLALDPTTGEEVWRCRGPSKLCYASPLVQDDIVVMMCGYHGPSMAVRTGGSGDVTESHRLWINEDKKLNPQRVGSGVIVGDYIYILNEPGIAWCMDLKTGQIQWEQRLGGKSWSSMIHAAGHLYAVNMDGDCFVLAADPQECKVLHTNKVGELTRASLAPANGKILIRTYEHLYCIGK